MTFDFSQLSGTDFAFGLFGACLVEIYRFKRLLDKNEGKVEVSKLQVLLNVVCFLFFIFGSGVLAATQGVSPEFSALYAGLTFPVFFSVILRDNAEAEKQLIAETKKAVLAEAEKKNQEVILHKNNVIESLGIQLRTLEEERRAKQTKVKPQPKSEPDTDNRSIFPGSNVQGRITINNNSRSNVSGVASDQSIGFQTRVEGGTTYTRGNYFHTKWYNRLIENAIPLIVTLVEVVIVSGTAVKAISLSSKYPALRGWIIAGAVCIIVLALAAPFARKSKRLQRFINGLF